MSVKTIAVDTRVYRRLSAAKREDEPFSKVIERLLTEAESAHTARDILDKLATIAPLSETDADVFMSVVAENRAQEAWDERDLR